MLKLFWLVINTCQKQKWRGWYSGPWCVCSAPALVSPYPGGTLLVDQLANCAVPDSRRPELTFSLGCGVLICACTPSQYGSLPTPTAGPPVCPPRYPVGGACAAFLRRSPRTGMPTPPLRVPEWAGAHLEPADAEGSCNPGWPRGPVCDLAADTAPRAPAAQVQILEMPSKTSVCTLKPEADAKPGMPMCLELWQADSNPRPLLLAGYEDGSVALWDVSERKVCSRVACHTEPVMGFDFDSQKTRGVSGSAEKALAVWSLDEQQALQVCRTHELTNPGIADVKIRPDCKILATAGWDHRVRVFHWRTMKPLAVLRFHSATVHCVAFAADGLLAAGSGDQRISIWSLYPTHSDMSAPLLGHAEGREVGAHAVA
ncbi:guanine nucleotide-binding protein subunit beta-like protein 1 isoform X4 [Mustela putorius furo]|uniref:Guanine nucleotide-binding protein subunit beta-like protein 1 isoform X4 n=1 Tax=Mustela putorius furo TaxID=9669 RepID=A0A8U0RBG7_MUSPF|nr:guanine nucleotide-binding protein subunit beta-like protein 1 isoform X4 [Mustela putorius furo]XP_044921248.1 guanine nucleotide-binding protein subunit beta-like protein 1 isoform X4 [Mustela putorius furo]XP_044921249.1 guanine nucleotide-binding protein subunit beta-like protein 1 isoform X4 [Mustela putorius furo]XP_044921250.1 guanine nucleotide-binding protein subunit beta-like protein 1 isoform X4 [Mustela putorius furo]XP_044921251.1 guanine nucleotide-binding protein subunit beta-